MSNIKESEPKFRSVHTKSTFDSTFGGWYSNYVPLSTKFMQKMIGKERVSVFHVGAGEYKSDIQQVGRIVGKKSSLSTFTKVDKGEKLAKGKGIQTGGGIIFQLEGSLLVASIRDMQTHPDNTGRRWVSPLYLAGKVAGSKMQRELEKGLKKKKIDRDSWEDQLWTFREKLDKMFPDMDYYEKEDIEKQEVQRKKNKWIKKYIDMSYKILSKYKKQIKRHILSQKDKPSEYGWNELIVNQIKVKDVFILERENYKETREAIEKVATGTITVGSPAQYRKWLKSKGGRIIE